MNLPSRHLFILGIIFGSLWINNFAHTAESTLFLIKNLNILELDTIKTSEEVLLNSWPQNANVFYNDSLIGSTPLFIRNSFRNITLKKTSYDDLDISFEEIRNRKIFYMNYHAPGEEKNFFETDIFKILTAGIIVLGATTAYFKLEADAKYDEYQHSGNSELLDDIRKYDLISAITFTALQINFGLLLYFFLSE